MQDFILIAIPLLVLYVAYGRLRGHIKALEDHISAQQAASQKLREANRVLQAELKRIESRIESRGHSQDPPSQPVSQAVPEVAKPPLYRVVPDEPAIPPPLPPSRAAVREEPAPAPRVGASTCSASGEPASSGLGECGAIRHSGRGRAIASESNSVA